VHDGCDRSHYDRVNNARLKKIGNRAEFTLTLRCLQLSQRGLVFRPTIRSLNPQRLIEDETKIDRDVSEVREAKSVKHHRMRTVGYMKHSTGIGGRSTCHLQVCRWYPSDRPLSARLPPSPLLIQLLAT
jgi:hypothetical protein